MAIVCIPEESMVFNAAFPKMFTGRLCGTIKSICIFFILSRKAQAEDSKCMLLQAKHKLNHKILKLLHKGNKKISDLSQTNVLCRL